MSDHATGCVEQIRKLGFKPGTRLNMSCPRCSTSIKVVSDNLDRIEIQRFLNDHGRHGSCFFGFNDGRRWEIQNDEGIESNEPQRIDLSVEAKTKKDVVSNPDISDGDTIEDYTWIKLYRKILKNPIFKDSEAYHLFSYLLLKANHKTNRFLFNKKEMVVKRGQLITGIRQISKDTEISLWKIRDRLRLLNDLHMTTQKTTHRFSIITICNYDYYQDSKERLPHTEPHTTLYLPPHTDHTLTTTNKNVRSKELKDGGRASKKPDADPRVKEFLDFWGETHIQRKGISYFFNFSKDGALTKKLLSTYGLQDLKQYALDFLNGDEQGERLGFTIGVFSQAVNRIAQKRTTDPVEQIKRQERLKSEREAQTP